MPPMSQKAASCGDCARTWRICSNERAGSSERFDAVDSYLHSDADKPSSQERRIREALLEVAHRVFLWQCDGARQCSRRTNVLKESAPKVTNPTAQGKAWVDD